MRPLFHFNSLSSPPPRPLSSLLLSVHIVSFLPSPPSASPTNTCYTPLPLPPKPTAVSLVGFFFSSYLRVSLPCLPFSTHFPSQSHNSSISNPSSSYLAPFFSVISSSLFSHYFPLLSATPSLLFTSTPCKSF